jgi:type II secretory pathway component PulK
MPSRHLTEHCVNTASLPGSLDSQPANLLRGPLRAADDVADVIPDRTRGGFDQQRDQRQQTELVEGFATEPVERFTKPSNRFRIVFVLARVWF